MTKNVNFKKSLFKFITVIAGNFIYALGIALFVLPNDLITGGVTGFSIFANAISDISVSTWVLIFNILLFILGYFAFGKEFAATTAVSTFASPIFLKILQAVIGSYQISQDKILCSIFGGLLIGVSIGIVIRAGSSTGGLDIAALFISKKFKLPLSPIVYIFDIIALVLQAMYHNGEEILYGILLITIYTVALDKTLMIGTSNVELKIISEHTDEIKEAILTNIDRGVTVVPAYTGYLNSDTELLLSVVSSREMKTTEELVHNIDPYAFVIITKVNEVSGRGFSLNKVKLSQETTEIK